MNERILMRRVLHAGFNADRLKEREIGSSATPFLGGHWGQRSANSANLLAENAVSGASGGRT
jgi:hypothetical protein